MFLFHTAVEVAAFTYFLTGSLKIHMFESSLFVLTHLGPEFHGGWMGGWVDE